MKRILLLSVLMILLCIAGNAKGIELEPRAGVSYSRVWGIHVGALTSLELSDRFYFQPGFLVNTVSEFSGKADGCKFGLDIPLYASYRIPVSNTAKVRLNVGPFAGISSQISLGTALEAGIEYRKCYIGASWFQNFVDRNCARLNLSVGYKFAL